MNNSPTLTETNALLGKVQKAKKKAVFAMDAASASTEPYEAQIAHYERISAASAYIVYNKTASGQPAAINHQAIQRIAWAMIKKVPIIFLVPPTYSENVPAFIKRQIENRLSKILVCDLSLLDIEDVQLFLSSVEAPTNYSLTKHEESLMRAQLRTHFRSLLPQIV